MSIDGVDIGIRKETRDNGNLFKTRLEFDSEEGYSYEERALKAKNQTLRLKKV